MIVSKPFCQDLHDKYDHVGKQMAKALFETLNIVLTDNTNKYGINLIAHRDGVKVGYVEAETRSEWGEHEFKYKTIIFKHSKKKYLHNDLRSVFVSFNNNYTLAYVVWDTTILDSPIVKRKNIYMEDGEYVYDVDLSNIKLIHLHPTIQ